MSAVAKFLTGMPAPCPFIPSSACLIIDLITNNAVYGCKCIVANAHEGAIVMLIATLVLLMSRYVIVVA